MKKKPGLTEFLAAEALEPRSMHHRCQTCLQEDVAENIAAFWAAREAGETNVPFQRYFEKYLRKAFPHVLSMDAVRKHVMKCLGRSIATGKPL